MGESHTRDACEKKLDPGLNGSGFVTILYVSAPFSPIEQWRIDRHGGGGFSSFHLSSS